MNGLKQICAECGHDIMTHYLDPQTGRRESCLGLHCDCRWYSKEAARSTPVLPAINFEEYGRKAKPHADTTCLCQACQEWTYRKYLNGW